ncbi:VanZ family protein [Halobacterium noricense]|uniref:VanZ family protein n=1 Tax=Halobacterium noricense TaxID=223182 RepID=UPI001E561C9A|nr:VanZ family protein [Halobacterium noricense]UHH24916.1 VanZ family protein [Halobacterium noricense]
MTPRRWRVLAVVSIAAVLAGSLAPGATAGGLPAGVDKFLHAAGYAMIALSLAGAQRAETGRTLVSIVLATALLGVGIEVVQPLVGRTASLLDAVANLLGATAGAFGWWVRTN